MLNPFQFWCQKVLPLVYDQSLSYYEVLCKLVNELNKVIVDINNYETLVSNKLDAQDTLINQYKQDLQDIVNDFISTVNSDLANYYQSFQQLYQRTNDLYNKTNELYNQTQTYIDNAIKDFGSVAVWSIVKDNLVATVFNDAVLIAIGMSPNGRLTITTDD